MEFEISFGDPKHRIPFFEWVHEYKCIIGKQKWKRKRKLREEVRISLSNLEEIENKNENEILFSDFVEKRLYVYALWAHQMHNSVDNLRDLQSGFRLPRTSECISMQTRNQSCCWLVEPWAKTLLYLYHKEFTIISKVLYNTRSLHLICYVTMDSFKISFVFGEYTCKQFILRNLFLLFRIICSLRAGYVICNIN